jgi:hypothetical protein
LAKLVKYVILVIRIIKNYVIQKESGIRRGEPGAVLAAVNNKEIAQ